VLKDFLAQFGQLLALDCAGDVSCFYNVTNIVSCIDFARSEKSSTGKTILKVEFLPEAIPRFGCAHCRLFCQVLIKSCTLGGKSLTGTLLCR
jgi:hypothetical protein